MVESPLLTTKDTNNFTLSGNPYPLEITSGSPRVRGVDSDLTIETGRQGSHLVKDRYSFGNCTVTFGQSCSLPNKEAIYSDKGDFLKINKSDPQDSLSFGSSSEVEEGIVANTGTNSSVGFIPDGSNNLISSQSSGVPYYPDGYCLNNMVVARSVRKIPHCLPDGTADEAHTQPKGTVPSHGYEHDSRGAKFPFHAHHYSSPDSVWHPT